MAPQKIEQVGLYKKGDRPVRHRDGIRRKGLIVKHGNVGKCPPRPEDFQDLLATLQRRGHGSNAPAQGQCRVLRIGRPCGRSRRPPDSGVRVGAPPPPGPRLAVRRQSKGPAREGGASLTGPYQMGRMSSDYRTRPDAQPDNLCDVSCGTGAADERYRSTHEVRWVLV